MSVKQQLKVLQEKAIWFKKNRKILISRLYLRIGAFFIRKGAILQPGQKIVLPKGKGPSLTGSGEVYRSQPSVVWIENMYYNFRRNAITYSFKDKPIKGLSEKFAESEKK